MEVFRYASSESVCVCVAQIWWWCVCINDVCVLLLPICVYECVCVCVCVCVCLSALLVLNDDPWRSKPQLAASIHVISYYPVLKLKCNYTVEQ